MYPLTLGEFLWVLAQVSPNPPQYANAPNGTYLKTKRAVRA